MKGRRVNDIRLLQREQHWTCPNCTNVEVTNDHRPHTRFHACRGLRGLTAPMVPAGTRCKVHAIERGDWVGKELVQTDGNGRPVMAVETVRDDGTDLIVLAPTATGKAD